MKENRFRGFWFLFILGSLFAALGLIAGIGGGTQSTESLITSGDILSPTKFPTGTVAIQVTAVDTEPWLIVENGTNVYVVEYKDTNDKYGYIGLEANPKDKTIQSLLKTDGELKQPVWLEVAVMQEGDDDALEGYQSAIEDMLNPESEFAQYLTTNYYVSHSVALEEKQSGLFGGLFIAGLGLLLIGFAIARVIKNTNAYKQIYTAYPELNGDIKALEQEADYVDNDLKLLLYKNHLISYHQGFHTQDLSQTKQVYHYQVNYRRLFITVSRQSFLVAINTNNKKASLPFKNIGNEKTDAELAPLYSRIQNQFPDITLGA